MLRDRWFTSLRARLFLLVLLAIVLAGLFLIYDGNLVGLMAALVVAILVIWVGSDRLIVNFQRQQTEAALRASESRFERTFTFSPFALAITRLSDGRLVDINAAFERLTGYTRDEALGRTPDELKLWINPQQRTDGLMHLRTGALIVNFEADFRMKDGSQRTCVLGGGLVTMDGQECVVTSLMDVTERKLAEEAARLARAEAERNSERITRLQAVTSELTAALTTAAVTEVILRQGAAILGAMIVSVKRLSGDGLWLESLGSIGFKPQIEYTYHRYPISVSTHMADAVRTGEPVWLGSQDEYIRRYPDVAQDVIIQGIGAACAIPLMAGNRILGGIGIGFSDVVEFNLEEREFLLTLTRQCAQALERARLYEVEQQARAELEVRVRERTAELEQSSAQLSNLSARLQATREEERQRLSRELHDQLGGALTGLKIDIAHVYRRTPEGELQAKLKNLLTTMDDMIQMVRQLATELRPGILDDFGLSAAIEWQLQEFEKRSGIRSRFLSSVESSIELDKDTATAVFRVFQEALTNVVRHAQASEVEVQFQQQMDYLILQVHDNGRGISTDDLANMKSLGLVGMRERVRLFSGELDIYGVPDEGTTVRVRIPFLNMPQ
jgi:PAS domain S-box-containing protein